MIVKLGDIAFENRENWTGSTEGVPIVGLEHLTPGEITLKDWTSDLKESTFTKKFRKGQVLLGRRRVYLRKAALAPFDGICSGDITVIESVPTKLLPELLPFIIQNDEFFDYAMKGSAGSLSPRVKWAHLANYTFNLPSLPEQKRLANLLWAAYDLKESYRRLLAASDELAKSRFVEMFGDPKTNSRNLPVALLGDIAFITKLAGFEYTKHIKYQKHGDIIMIRGLNCKSGKLVLDDIYWISKEVSDSLPRSQLTKGDIVLTYVGTVGEVAIIDKDNTYHLAPNVAKVSLYDKKKNNPVFWDYMLMMTKDYILRFASTTTQSSLSMEKIRKIPFIVPNTADQNRFAEEIEQLYKSKVALQESIRHLDVIIRTFILNQIK